MKTGQKLNFPWQGKFTYPFTLVWSKKEYVNYEKR